ncbi:spindle assembly checkpoint kinase-like [Dendronephthya gigantea]|uniref:spindle assembly checkpoint kinase-like n=1 Tax=Dendronephthya gigantea TaxID=151771 RepID=UPI00106A3671|nr:spindle assembly checkpoint kinase-like [Dendronephthya gigantea]
MAHFNMAIHTASGAVANGGIRNDLGEIPVQSGKQSDHLPAKLRRISRPNTIEEIRLRRRSRKKKQRERNRSMSKSERRLEKKRKTENKDLKQVNKIKALVVRVKKERKRAVDFWRLWDKEKMLHSASNINVHQIEEISLKDFDDGKHDIGEGTFGVCRKKVYRGHIVAVKYFKDNSLSSDVEKEALMISAFDHPGLPFLFGANVKNKPYLLVTEFYSIDGQCVTLQNAVKGMLSLSIPKWANILEKISEALSYIHSKGFIHGDIKGNNIVIRKQSDSFYPVIIDFGKMKKK